MALSDFFASRLARPAGRVLDAPIRDIVHEILREHGYASPAEVQALRDELRDLRGKVDGVDRRLVDLSRMADEAKAVSLAARTEAQAASTRAAAAEAAAQSAGARATAAEGEARAASARADAAEAAAAIGLAQAASPAIAHPTEPAPLPAPAATVPDVVFAEPRHDCKVDECDEPVRSKGFCSAHYQQWRRGTLKGFVSADGTALVDGEVVHLPSETVGGAVTAADGTVRVDGRPVTPL